MDCPKCGSEVKEEDQFCAKCGFKVDNNKEQSEEKEHQKKSKKRTVIAMSILVIFGIAVAVRAYEGYQKYVDGYHEGFVMSDFSNDDERVPIDSEVYGKETAEEVLVEFVQAVCDDDSERLLHIMPPVMMNHFLAAIIGETDYEIVLECFKAYQRDYFNLSVRPAEVWKCDWITSSVCGQEVVKAENENWQNILMNTGRAVYSEQTDFKITQLKKMDFNMTYGENEEAEINSNYIYVCKIDGRWYLDLWMTEDY